MIKFIAQAIKVGSFSRKSNYNRQSCSGLPVPLRCLHLVLTLHLFLDRLLKHDKSKYSGDSNSGFSKYQTIWNPDLFFTEDNIHRWCVFWPANGCFAHHSLVNIIFFGALKYRHKHKKAKKVGSMNPSWSASFKYVFWGTIFYSHPILTYTL